MAIALGKQVVEINGAVEYGSRRSEEKEQASGCGLKAIGKRPFGWFD